MKKLKSLIELFRAKHYAVIVGDSEEEIDWAIKALSVAVAKERSKDEH